MKHIFNWFENRINPYPESIEQASKQGFWQFIANCMQGVWFWVICLAILSAGVAIFEAYLFQIMGKVVDWLGEETPASFWINKKNNIYLIVGIILASLLLTLLAVNIRLQTLQGAFPMRLRWRFHRLLLEQSFKFYQDEFAGRIATKVMQTALAVREVVLKIADIFVYILVYFISISVVLYHLDTWLLLPFACWLLSYILMMAFFVPKIAQSSHAQADARSLMTGRITDAYTNIMTVKLFSHSKQELDYSKFAMQEFLLTVRRQMRYVSLLELCNHFINISLILSVILLNIVLWQNSLLSLGAVAASVAMTFRLNGISNWIMWETAQLFENIGTVRDGINTFSAQQTVKDEVNASALKVTAGEIYFKNICYGYKSDALLFNQFELKINAGEKIGLVGRSGAGKTSLVNLLLRFYDINSGTILIDNQDIKQVTQESLRAQIGMVTQDISLLHRTIRENILYGNKKADEQSMLAAAKQAQAHEFIQYLSDQYGNHAYDVMVGERGIKLSGGQRQRIAIARVMLKNAPILLLDEATSALDSEVEAVIQDSLEKLMQGKTVIAIAHRLSTIAAMDKLVVLDQGKIVEMGNHQQLLANNGLYAQLWSRQSGGFLADK